tara:strand:- start:90502 stop:91044 length:543 start_codon:yes stop_codon:yes gene_type:complete
MALRPYVLLNFFSAVNELSERFQESSKYDPEIRQVFINAITEEDLSKKELRTHFRDKIVATNIVTKKLQNWLEGFLDDDLVRSTPNESLNEKIYKPDINPNYSVPELLKIYKIDRSLKTVYDWVKKEKLVSTSVVRPHLYRRVDFEHMLNNKGVKFNDELVKKHISLIANTFDTINGRKN